MQAVTCTTYFGFVLPLWRDPYVSLLLQLPFPQRILKSGLESPVDLLVGTPGTLLEFRERGMSLSFFTCLCKRGTTKENNRGQRACRSSRILFLISHCKIFFL